MHPNMSKLIKGKYEGLHYKRGGIMPLPAEGISKEAPEVIRSSRRSSALKLIMLIDKPE